MDPNHLKNMNYDAFFTRVITYTFPSFRCSMVTHFVSETEDKLSVLLKSQHNFVCFEAKCKYNV